MCSSRVSRFSRERSLANNLSERSVWNAETPSCAFTLEKTVGKFYTLPPVVHVVRCAIDAKFLLSNWNVIWVRFMLKNYVGHRVERGKP